MHNAHFYIEQANMSARPEYYSGRGPTTSDLGHRELVKIHGLVKAHGGQDAADSFVAMVAGISSGAATTFLLGLYELERQDWKWRGAPQHINREYDLGEDRDRAEAVGFATIMSAFGRRGRDESADDYAVRGAFLAANGYTRTSDGKGWRKLEAGEQPRRARRDYLNDYSGGR